MGVPWGVRGVRIRSAPVATVASSSHERMQLGGRGGIGGSLGISMYVLVRVGGSSERTETPRMLDSCDGEKLERRAWA